MELDIPWLKKTEKKIRHFKRHGCGYMYNIERLTTDSLKVIKKLKEAHAELKHLEEKK